MSKLFTSIFFLLISIFSFSQEVVTNSSMDVMKSNGKIYVVVAVVLTILIGLYLYVWRLDKKISALEQNKNV
ncbi:MAG: CcmD family protein [Chitinophagaceae bacterium]|nr:CcmD family protein [Chitinophagaceae bacterium]